MYAYALFAASILGLASAQAYTQPTNATFGALYTPNTSTPATRGQSIQVTWDPTGHTTDGATISLVLCHGPSTNCVNAPTAIVTGVPAVNAAYTWNVPCSLTPGTENTDTGYGMLIIVDGTGQFQYSTQFSVLAGTTCGSTSSSSMSSSNSSSMSKTSSSTSMPAPPSSSNWQSWTTTTTPKPQFTSPSTIHTGPSVAVPPAPTTSMAASPAASTAATPSAFHGAAAKVGSSAAGLVVAVGAAFFAL